MSWSSYLSFLAFAVVLVLVPGPDFAVVTKNTLTGGRQRGSWSALGVCMSNCVQGLAAVAGLGALIVRVEPLFEAIKWAGVAYLLYLGVQALRSARAGRYAALDEPDAGQAAAGWRQGFLSNITNPKVLVFYLAVLPQSLGPHASIAVLMLFALSHACLSVCYLLLVVNGIHRARRWLAQRRVRRSLDVVTGTVLLGFGAKLAVSSA